MTSSEDYEVLTAEEVFDPSPETTLRLLDRIGKDQADYYRGPLGYELMHNQEGLKVHLEAMFGIKGRIIEVNYTNDYTYIRIRGDPVDILYKFDRDFNLVFEYKLAFDTIETHFPVQNTGEVFITLEYGTGAELYDEDGNPTSYIIEMRLHRRPQYVYRFNNYFIFSAYDKIFFYDENAKLVKVLKTRNFGTFIGVAGVLSNDKIIFYESLISTAHAKNCIFYVFNSNMEQEKCFMVRSPEYVNKWFTSETFGYDQSEKYLEGYGFEAKYIYYLNDVL